MVQYSTNYIITCIAKVAVSYIIGSKKKTSNSLLLPAQPSADFTSRVWRRSTLPATCETWRYGHYSNSSNRNNNNNNNRNVIYTAPFENKVTKCFTTPNRKQIVINKTVLGRGILAASGN